ncbi:MAG: DHHW family protein [Eubacterium sp.]|nr:DHHW family protein [Eubacterium sp.]
MNKKVKSIISFAIIAAFFVTMVTACWAVPSKQYSDSERRDLAQFPKVDIKTLLDGSFMTKFESYTQDQFPLREKFRTLKAMMSYYVFRQLDNNDIYIKDGYAAKIEYPLSDKSLDYAAGRFEYVYKKFMEGKASNVYLSIVPDKSYFLADKGGYLKMDYEKLVAAMKDKMTYAQYIDIMNTLEISDYYKTDTHWRQEKLIETAKVLASGMGVTLAGQYRENTLDNPFYGVYYGQAALPMPAETIKYLTSDILDNCIVTNYETGKKTTIYDMEKAYGKDPYQMFLSGSISLMTIENPNATTDKELVIFRDSFGSSITPLLVEGYAKITLVDIRYINPDYLGRFVNFEGSDILFLYSTLVLNNSETIK